MPVAWGGLLALALLAGFEPADAEARLRVSAKPTTVAPGGTIAVTIRGTRARRCALTLRGDRFGARPYLRRRVARRSRLRLSERSRPGGRILGVKCGRPRAFTRITVLDPNLEGDPGFEDPGSEDPGSAEEPFPEDPFVDEPFPEEPPADPAPEGTPPGSPPPPAPARRRITVDNRVTNGATAMREDPTPVRLTTRPWVYCGRRGCNINGTERVSGQIYDAAVCQTTGERTTNGDDTSSVDDRNPGLFTSTRYYGVRLTDGRFGYVSEVWIHRNYRGGLGLPRC